jgi:hypothetical protein
LTGENGVLIPVKLTPYSPPWLPASRIYFDLSVRPLEELLRILRAKYRGATTVMPSAELQPVEGIDVSGAWSSEEHVGDKMARVGLIRLHQTSGDLSGHGGFTEFHPTGGMVTYELLLHGEIDQQAASFGSLHRASSRTESRRDRTASIRLSFALSAPMNFGDGVSTSAGCEATYD